MTFLKLKQQKYFFYTTIFGALCIIGGNGINISGQYGIIAPTIFILGVQSAYVFLTFKSKLIEEFGVLDSFYYLGFLFTLITMVASFYNFEVNSDTITGQNISNLIAQNGVALSSTVFGMTTRLLVRMSLSNSSNELDVHYTHPTPQEIEIYVKLMQELRSINTDLKSIGKIGVLAKGAGERVNFFGDSLDSTTEKLTNLIESIKLLETSSTASEAAARNALAKLLTTLNDGKKTLRIERNGIATEVQQSVLDIQDHINLMSGQAKNIESFNKKLLKMYSLLNGRVSLLLKENDAKRRD